MKKQIFNKNYLNKVLIYEEQPFLNSLLYINFIIDKNEKIIIDTYQ
jgi:hypothetical protein